MSQMIIVLCLYACVNGFGASHELDRVSFGMRMIVQGFFPDKDETWLVYDGEKREWPVKGLENSLQVA